VNHLTEPVSSLAKVIKYESIEFKVRDKMLYASTRATLTKELGDYRFVDSVYGSTTVSLSVNKHFSNAEFIAN